MQEILACEYDNPPGIFLCQQVEFDGDAMNYADFR